MGVMDLLTELTSRALAASLTEAQKQRGVALIVARAARPDTDASDQIALANFVVTGYGDIPMAPEPRDDPYPHASGDATVLGPEIFASTDAPYSPGTVICWRGRNFVPQTRDEAWAKDADDSGPTPPDADPVFDPAAPAPMAGSHWQGKRG